MESPTTMPSKSLARLQNTDKNWSFLQRMVLPQPNQEGPLGIVKGSA